MILCPSVSVTRESTQALFPSDNVAQQSILFSIRTKKVNPNLNPFIYIRTWKIYQHPCTNVRFPMNGLFRVFSCSNSVSWSLSSSFSSSGNRCSAMLLSELSWNVNHLICGRTPLTMASSSQGHCLYRITQTPNKHKHAGAILSTWNVSPRFQHSTARNNFVQMFK